MLENLNFGSVGTGIMKALQWMLISLCVTFFAYLVWRWKQFKHTIVIKKPTDQGRMVKYEKFRIKENKRKSQREWIMKGGLLPMNDKKIPIADKEAISINNKGGFHVAAYETQSGEVQYVTNDNDASRKERPLKSEDKTFYLNELKDGAEKYRESRNWKDVVIMATPYMTLVIILALTFIFWDRVVAPAGKLGSSLEKATENLAHTCGNVQNVGGGVGNVTIPN